MKNLFKNIFTLTNLKRAALLFTLSDPNLTYDERAEILDYIKGNDKNLKYENINKDQLEKAA